MRGLPTWSSEDSWAAAVELIAQQVVAIRTPTCSGTGFVSYGRRRGTRIVATAQHVVEAAIDNEEQILVRHGQVILTLGMKGLDTRFVHKTTAGIDSAILVFPTADLPLPKVRILNPAEAGRIKVGTEVGWLGFPALATVTDQLCFFSGRVSAVDSAGRYLLDGTNVHGCSGGPAFCITLDGPRIIGVISQYIPNDNFRDERGERIGLAPGLTGITSVINYTRIEDALDRGLPEDVRGPQKEIKISWVKCPECGAGLVKGPHPDEGQTPALLCGAGCGPLVDLMDEALINQFPGGPRGFNQYFLERYESTEAS